MEEYKDYKLKSGNILRIIQDEYAEPPDTWGNEDIFLVYDHRLFTIRREGFEPRDIFEHVKALHTGKNKDRIEPLYEEYFIFNVYAYIHSGISLSLNNNSYPFSDRFDVSTTGYILIEKNQVTQGEKDEESEKDAKEYAEGLIETWNQYLSGDVWGFKVLEPIKTYTITEKELNELTCDLINISTNGGERKFIYKDQFLDVAYETIELEELDSCWGFYGDDPKINGMIDDIDDEIIEEIN